MQREKVLRIAIFNAKLRDSQPNAHALRLRWAKKVLDLVNAFIAEEVAAATQKPESSEAHLTWSQVANALEITKSKAFRTYGTNQTKSD